MPGPNRMFVTNPIPQNAKYGLASVTTAMPAPIPAHWANGVFFKSYACTSSNPWPDPCSGNPPVGTFTTKIFDEGENYDNGDPFAIYHGFECKLINLDEAKEVAALQFSLSEPQAVERAFWTGTVGNYPALATDPALIVLPAATNMLAAVGALEQELANDYGAVGVLHSPRLAMPYLWRNVVPDGPTLRTQLGTMWAFGLGYDPTIGPTGHPAPGANQVYLYATGMITSRKSDVFQYPTDGHIVNRTTNEFTIMSERTWVLTRECVTIAILTDLVVETS